MSPNLYQEVYTNSDELSNGWITKQIIDKEVEELDMKNYYKFLSNVLNRIKTKVINATKKGNNIVIYEKSINKEQYNFCLYGYQNKDPIKDIIEREYSEPYKTNVSLDMYFESGHLYVKIILDPKIQDRVCVCSIM